MTRTPSSPVDGVSRRSVVASLGVGCSLSLSGCIDSARSVVDSDAGEQLSLSIVTVPADDDRASIRITRELESHLRSVGIDVSVAMRSRSAFLEAVLLEHEFDLYVGRHPAAADPDFLYEMLHSTYANDSGWQNPFGFTNMAFDEFLEAQREADGEQRVEHIESALQGLAQEKPFEPICFPDESRLARTDRIEGWTDDHRGTRLDYLGLEPAAGAGSTMDRSEDGGSDAVNETDGITESDETNGTPESDGTNGTTETTESKRESTNTETVDELRALLTDARPTQNLNPLSATVRERATSIALLYDSLGTVIDGRLQPWLAESWEWADGDTAATISLREDCQFHDGEPLTADDVAFTYRFLSDTALEQGPAPSPAPRYCGPVSTVDEIRVLDDSRLKLSFAAGRAASRRAFTVPILPEHVWRDRVETRIERADEFTAPQGHWHVVTTENVPPIGSGPYQFANRSDRDHLTLERFGDHFTLREDVDYPGPSVERLRFEVDPGSESAARRVIDGDADVTASMLEPQTIDELPVPAESPSSGDGPEQDPSSETVGEHLEHLTTPSRTFYHVGFNTRKAPLSNVHFRRAVARLLDKEWLVDSVFNGHAHPTASPIGEEWTPTALEWESADPDLVPPFLGTDGELDVEAARTVFEAAGFRYDGGRLL